MGPGRAHAAHEGKCLTSARPYPHERPHLRLDGSAFGWWTRRAARRWNIRSQRQLGRSGRYVALLGQLQVCKTQAARTECIVVSRRHAANSLAIGRVARQLGVPPKRKCLCFDRYHTFRADVITLLAEPCGCSAQNVFRGSIYLQAGKYGPDLLDGARLDATYGQVTPSLIKNTLTGRNDLLPSGPGSNVVLYLTGHGGDGFLKFHDADELSAIELANAISEMRHKRRFRKLLIIVDTCQAASLYKHLQVGSSVLAFASSRLGENAYASPPDATIGVALADRFTEYVAAHFFGYGQMPNANNETLGAFATRLARARTRSTLEVHDASWFSDSDDRTEWQTTSLSEFFGASPAGIVRLTGWPFDSALPEIGDTARLETENDGGASRPRQASVYDYRT